MKFALTIAALVILTLIGLNLSKGNAATPAPISVVDITNYAYSPDQLTVTEGQSVRFINHDDVAHTVTEKDNAFDSGPINTGKSWTYKFDKSGTYSYYCAIHPSMRGTITVTSP